MGPHLPPSGHQPAETPACPETCASSVTLTTAAVSIAASVKMSRATRLLHRTRTAGNSTQPWDRLCHLRCRRCDWIASPTVKATLADSPYAALLGTYTVTAEEMGSFPFRRRPPHQAAADTNDRKLLTTRSQKRTSQAARSKLIQANVWRADDTQRSRRPEACRPPHRNTTSE